jgi:hypothetical protein
MNGSGSSRTFDVIIISISALGWIPALSAVRLCGVVGGLPRMAVRMSA